MQYKIIKQVVKPLDAETIAAALVFVDIVHGREEGAPHAATLVTTKRQLDKFPVGSVVTATLRHDSRYPAPLITRIHRARNASHLEQMFWAGVKADQQYQEKVYAKYHK